jgi:hypothetical protein
MPKKAAQSRGCKRYKAWLQIQARLTEEEKAGLDRFAEAIHSRAYLRPESEYVKIARAHSR